MKSFRKFFTIPFLLALNCAAVGFYLLFILLLLTRVKRNELAYVIDDERAI